MQESIRNQSITIDSLKKINKQLIDKISELEGKQVRVTEMGNVEFLLEEERLMHRTTVEELKKENEILKTEKQYLETLL